MNYHNINNNISLKDHALMSFFMIFQLVALYYSCLNWGRHGYTNDNKLSLYSIIDSE